jgi:hypothetical protein
LQKTWTKEQKDAHKEKLWEQAERRLERQLPALDTPGQYGIQIALMEMDGGYTGGGHGSSVVPVPGALWLFGTGLIALLGFGRRLPKHA